MAEVATNPIPLNGENTGRWSNEEHGAFLEGLKAHGKEWKKIAKMIETRTVVQIRTHAQKYFQKLAKSREQKGEEIPQDLVSTASNPRNVPDKNKRGGANSGRRRTNSNNTNNNPIKSSAKDPENTTTTTTTDTDTDTGVSNFGHSNANDNKIGVSPISGVKIDNSFSNKKINSISLRSDTPLPVDVLGEVEAHTSRQAFQQQQKSPSHQLYSVYPLGMDDHNDNLNVAGAANSSSSILDDNSPINFNNMIEDVVTTNTNTSLIGANNDLYFQSQVSPVAKSNTKKQVPFSSPQHKLAVASPPKCRQSAILGYNKNGKKYDVLNGKYLSSNTDGSNSNSKLRKLTISTALINDSAAAASSFGEDVLKSRDEEDLKWLMSMSSRLPDGSPTAVSDFMWGQDDDFCSENGDPALDAVEDIFSLQQKHKEEKLKTTKIKVSISENTKNKTKVAVNLNKPVVVVGNANTTVSKSSSKSNKPVANNKNHKRKADYMDIAINNGMSNSNIECKKKQAVDVVPTNLASDIDEAEAQSIEEWISSSENGQSPNSVTSSNNSHMDDTSDLLSVSDCGELENQPELAEMGPFTKYVFGDEENDTIIEPVTPTSKRLKIVA